MYHWLNEVGLYGMVCIRKQVFWHKHILKKKWKWKLKEIWFYYEKEIFLLLHVSLY